MQVEACHISTRNRQLPGAKRRPSSSLVRRCQAGAVWCLVSLRCAPGHCWYNQHHVSLLLCGAGMMIKTRHVSLPEPAPRHVATVKLPKHTMHHIQLPTCAKLCCVAQRHTITNLHDPAPAQPPQPACRSNIQCFFLTLLLVRRPRCACPCRARCAQSLGPLQPRRDAMRRGASLQG